MQPKYKIIVKNQDLTFTSYDVKRLNFEKHNNLPVVLATYVSIPADPATPEIMETMETVVHDEVTNWLYQCTNAFDSQNMPIYHGDLLEDKDGILYEVMYAVGSYFIVKDDEAVILLDKVTRYLTIKGNVIENSDLIKVDITALEEVVKNI